MTTNGSHVSKIHEKDVRKAQRPPAVSQTDIDKERAEGEGMGTARVVSPAGGKDADGGPLLQRARDGIKHHPYIAMLATAAVGAGIGLLMSSRVTRAITVRAGTFAVTEILLKFLKEAIASGSAVQP